MPHEQHDQSANHSTEQTGLLSRPIPADRLADPGRYEGAGNTEQGGENETGRIVWAGRQQARDDAGDKADEDDPDNVHDDPRLVDGPCRKCGHQ